MRDSSSIPIFFARARSSGLRNFSRPRISPPRHLSAAAASTPSGAPPVPMTAWTAVPDTATDIAAIKSPSSMSLMRAPATLRYREDRDRVRAAFRDRVRPFERVDRDIDLGADALADLLADVEHRRLVALALADDDAPVERDLVHRLAHCFHGRPVGLVVISVTHPVRGGDRRGLGDADKLQTRCAFDHVSQR